MNKSGQFLWFEVEKISPASGKTDQALAYSRQRRREILKLFNGELPSSIMRVEQRKKRASDLSWSTYEEVRKRNLDEQLKKRLDGQTKHPGLTPQAYAKAFGISGGGVRYGALSGFFQNVGRIVVRLYSNVGDTVVDPFAGHNSRMELVVSEGRHYRGYDVSERFMEHNRNLVKGLQFRYPMKIRLLCEDSRNMYKTPGEYGDFTLTSPPYYDLEFYGDEPNQLGKAFSYEHFLEGLTSVAQENYRVLKEGAFCIWFINDFRRGGIFHAYHVDVFEILKMVGFTPHDMIIVDLGKAFRQVFAGRVMDEKILPKQHEYGIVMRKVCLNHQEKRSSRKKESLAVRRSSRRFQRIVV